MQRSIALACALVSLVPAWAGAQLSPVGPEFQVNTYTTAAQLRPSVSAAYTGHFIVAWDSPQDGDSHGVVARRFQADGTPLGAELVVNTYTTGTQYRAAVAGGSGGSFVVVWEGPEPSGADSGIHGRRYDGNGAPLGGEFQVNAYTTGNQRRVAVADDPTGGFVVAWDGYQDGASLSVVGRRYDSTGTPLAGEFQVNTVTTAQQYAPSVAVDQNGNFVVVWTGFEQDSYGASFGVFGQRYDAYGAAVGGEFTANTYTTGTQGQATVSTDGSGGFIVAWMGAAQDAGYSTGIFGQRYDSSGVATGGEFGVNAYVTGNQAQPAVTADTAGNFLVVWDSDDGDGRGVFGRYFDAMGTPVGGDFQVNTYTTGNQYNAVAAVGSGGFLVAWQSPGQDGDSWGVFAQRLALPTTTTTSTTSTTLPPALVLGRRMVVKDPTGEEARRTVVALGRETASDIASLTGDPTVDGATLRVVTTGGTPSDVTYALDANGWTAIGTGYRYVGPTTGDPVKRVILKRTAAGTVVLRAVLRGSVGTLPLAVVPPNPGSAGGVVLSIGGGASYCVAFGAAAGGTITADGATEWKIRTATGQGCPAP